MKITAIAVYQEPLPVAGKPYKMSRTEVSDLSSTVVEIVTDTGLRGYGENLSDRADLSATTCAWRARHCRKSAPGSSARTRSPSTIYIAPWMPG